MRSQPDSTHVDILKSVSGWAGSREIRDGKEGAKNVKRDACPHESCLKWIVPC